MSDSRAERMGCAPSHATVVVGTLESNRLIARRPRPLDRRARQLVIIPDGAEFRERGVELLNEEPEHRPRPAPSAS